MIRMNENEGGIGMNYYRGFIGSYTRKSSKGIRAFRFNDEEFVVEDFFPVEEPSYLLLSKDGETLYSAMKDGDAAGVLSLNLSSGESTKLTFPGERTPCHLAWSQNALLASNYHQGRFDVYETVAGKVTQRLHSFQHTGKGPVEGRQDSPHIHFAQKNPYNSDILVCDLGTDLLHIYRQEPAFEKVSEVLLPPGSGPRHLVFHGKAPVVYVFSELTSEIFTLDFSQGEYRMKQAIPTLPEDFQGENTGAAIRISPDNRFLYVSNRGHDSLSVFEIKENHQLRLVEIRSTEGDHPRDFNLTSDGAFLLVGNMNSNTLTLFKRDRETGKLQLLKKDQWTPEPTCILFQP